MKRPTVYLTLLFLLVAFISCKQKKVELSDEYELPNIIFIMADDLGYGDVGCYGQDSIKTPNIDQMADEGMKFTSHYAGTSVCAPSRCVLMTGMHTGHAAIRGNKQAEPHGQMPLPDSTITVAEHLKKVGYNTAMIGKWGLGITDSEGDPNNQGFDFFYGYTDQVLAHNYYPEYLVKNGERVYLDNEVKYLDSTAWHKGLGSYATEKNEYSHDLFTEEALRFIERQKDSTFFLYLPYTIPHNNGEAPENEKQEVPDQGIYADKNWPKETKDYAAMITRMDRDVGKISDKIKKLGLEENTVIFFTSDNGPMPDKDFTLFFDSNGQLKGGKRDLYEGGIRVPMIVKWEGVIEKNTESDHMSAFWDVLPTLCDIAMTDIPESIDGISFLPELLGKKQPKHEYLYWEFHEQGKKQALRYGKWKAVRLNVAENPGGAIELYDLSSDLSESNNVADKYPDMAKKLTIMMDSARSFDPNWVF